MEKKKTYFLKILEYIKNKQNSGITIYPPKKEIFNAFKLTEFKDIKVVILGQDPYHGPNQAHGLAFSVLPTVPIPPTLQNIYKELRQDIKDFKQPNHGFLKTWANQGVLLLNNILTVEAGKAGSHSKIGWEKFTDNVILTINKYSRKIIFLLWGAHAQKKSVLINKQHHYVLYAPHPSPLSAHKGFFGCKHFSCTNRILEKNNKTEINWNIK